ncbi:hypothetical protein LCGC14_2368190 [marine sediment metagenome]|uniref:Uncharacterized protein n=1 Tax=marine sediment metagenome TaxID=412755 RepID=A0A0F9EH06_9ZZZZ
MDINHTSMTVENTGLDQFEYKISANYHWLNLGFNPYITLFLPSDPAARKAVLSRLRSSFNRAVDEALKAEDLAGLDAEVAEPELAGSTA